VLWDLSPMAGNVGRSQTGATDMWRSKPQAPPWSRCRAWLVPDLRLGQNSDKMAGAAPRPPPNYADWMVSREGIEPSTY